MIKLTLKEDDTDEFLISDLGASELGIEENELLLARNPINKKSVVGRAAIETDIEEDKISLDRTLFESIGLDSGFEIEVEKYSKKPKTVREVEFGIESRGNPDQDPLVFVKENEGDFLNFISDKIFTKDSKFPWSGKGLLISIKETYPGMDEDDAADLSDLEDFSYAWGGSELKSFDGLLLIDMSGSMETEDLDMEDIDWLVDRISRALDGDTSKEFLKNLEGEDKIKRSEGAAFCALMYLVQKIGRGVGDKISIIPFSSEAETVYFDDKRFFSSSTGTTEDAAENIIKSIKYHIRSHTNISTALEEAIETIKDFERDKMKMIVILTDGKPNPPAIDDPRKVNRIVEERLAPRRDVIINTIGLGEDVDHGLLDEIAHKSGGEYTYVTTLQGLTQAYSRYATSISIKGTSFMD